MTCEDSVVSADSCNCTFAERLFEQGLLTCEDESSCPVDCPVCGTCLSILGCNVTNVPPTFTVGGGTISPSTILFIIGAALIVLLIALIVYRARRRSSKKLADNDLSTNLMSGNGGPRYDEEITDVPHARGGGGFVVPIVQTGTLTSEDEGDTSDEATTTSMQPNADTNGEESAGNALLESKCGMFIAPDADAASTMDEIEMARVYSTMSKDPIEMARMASTLSKDTIEMARVDTIEMSRMYSAISTGTVEEYSREEEDDILLDNDCLHGDVSVVPLDEDEDKDIAIDVEQSEEVEPASDDANVSVPLVVAVDSKPEEPETIVAEESGKEVSEDTVSPEKVLDEKEVEEPSAPETPATEAHTTTPEAPQEGAPQASPANKEALKETEPATEEEVETSEEEATVDVAEETEESTGFDTTPQVAEMIVKEDAPSLESS